jgi:lipoate-protein ligase A
MTKMLFTALHVFREVVPYSAAMNMAMDEALLEFATVPLIRFYQWYSPAVSFGYFGKFSDVAGHASKRDLVRRWTGGGIVFHGNDLTYSIVIPAGDPTFRESSIAIYEVIHRALCAALNECGEHAVIAEHVDAARFSAPTRAGVNAAGQSCFATPVRADVIVDGRKVAGAAQRRTRLGLLQQGSIQGLLLEDDLALSFSVALSANCIERTVDEAIFKHARDLAQQKYGTDKWLHKR